MLDPLIPAVVEAPRCSARFAKFSEAELEEISEYLTLSTDLIRWYSEAAPVEFKLSWYSESLVLYSPSDLLSMQEGYRWAIPATGELCYSVIEEGWFEHWLVIGEMSGDPIIADVQCMGTPIYTFPHGLGSWNLKALANNLGSFFVALATWIEVCLKKYDYQLLDENFFIKPDVVKDLETGLTGIVDENSLKTWLSY